MPRLLPVDSATAPPQVRALVERVEEHLGFVPNFVRTLAASPGALHGFLEFAGALENASALDPALRAQVALSVSEYHECRYCVDSYAQVGQLSGLSRDALEDGRRGRSPDRRADAALVFARELVDARGRVSDESLERLRQAGFGEREIVELVATSCLAVFTNYLNHVAGTEPDFPLSGSVPAF